MKKMMKKVMSKPMKAQKGKQARMYDDDANDRIMADTYADYMIEKQAEEKAKAKPKPKPKPAPKPLPKPTKTVAKPMKSMKMGGTMKKAQLGMKSVKAGYDNNKGVTRADFVSIGKGEAKKGTKMKKAQMGTDMMQSPMMQSPMMKKGGAMKKCKYGCK